MKYYKALDENMCASIGDGMKFELDKKYEIDGEVIPCKNGFHFCKELKDTWNFYSLKDRFFEVAPGDIVIDSNNGKSVTNSIILVREITREEIDKYIIDNLEALVNDEHWMIRAEIASQGYGLDILVNDECSGVRVEVANQRFGLDILINDEDEEVRYAVARQGYRLDILINDEHWWVRTEVARQGYGLDVLIDDYHPYVRGTATAMLNKVLL